MEFETCYFLLPKKNYRLNSLSVRYCPTFPYTNYFLSSRLFLLETKQAKLTPLMFRKEDLFTATTWLYFQIVNLSYKYNNVRCFCCCCFVFVVLVSSFFIPLHAKWTL
jgi:hypothetical protein